MAENRLPSQATAVDEPEDLGSRKWLVLLVVSIGSMMGMLDSTIVAVAIPNIASSFGTNFEGIKWVSIGYLLTNGSLMPIMGRIGDLFGLKRSYLFGFATFVIGSALCGMAWNTPSLVLFRVIQAVGASNMYPIALSIVNNSFPSSQKGQALGLYSSAGISAVMFGPVLGGVLVDNFGWRSIFYVNVPIGLLAIFLALLVVPRDRARGEGSFDYVGAIVLASSISFLLFGINEGPEAGWGSLLIFGCFWLAAFLMFVFIVHQTSTAQPLIPSLLFRRRNYLTVLGTNLMMLSVETGATFLLPFFMGNILGYGPTKRGLMMLPTAFGIMCTAPIGGKLADKLGPKLPAFLGIAIAGYGTYGFTFLNSSSGVMDLVRPMFISGLGVGLLMAPMTSAALARVPVEMSGVASGILSLARNLGGPIGLSVMTVVDSQRMAFHSANLVQTVNQFSPTAVTTINALQAQMARAGLMPDQVRIAVNGFLEGRIAEQAFVMAFNDTFLITAIVLWLGLLPGLTLKNERADKRARGGMPAM
ncbi:MAG: DHA2 family efflux MFS transporter permease subunit [Chloroflexota bacterium]|jgi:EmrB/QacA subfamily drug resistance transporter